MHLFPVSRPSHLIWCRCHRLLSHAATSASATSTNRPLIQSLDLGERIEKLPVRHPFITSLAIGKVDKSVLPFPEVIVQPEEISHVQRQKNEVREKFARLVIEKPNSLRDHGFDELWRMSVTESSSVFEAMGNSRYEESDSLTKWSVEEVRKDPLLGLDFSCKVVQLILHNCLIQPLIRAADNEELKKRLMSRGTGSRIGFAYTEKHPSLGAMIPPDWKSEAKKKDANTWLVSGTKSYILDQEYDDYLIFCKTTNFVPDIVHDVKDRSLDQDRNDYAVTAFLLPKDRIDTITVFQESGIKYQTISFPDLMLTTDDMVFAPSQSGLKVNAVRSLARVAVSAFLLGRLKSLFHACTERVYVRGEDVVDRIHMLKILLRIFELESLVYYTSGLMDSFEGRDVHVEGMLLKSIANEFSHSCVDFGQKVLGSRHPIAGSWHDSLEVFDSFMDCSLHHKILTGLQAMHLYGQYRNDYVHKTELPFFFLIESSWLRFKEMRLTKPKPKLSLELHKSFDHRLKKESDSLERQVLRLEWLVKSVVSETGRDSGRLQISCSRIGEYSGLVFKCMSVLSRVSRSLRLQSPTSEQELQIARESVVRFERTAFEIEQDLLSQPRPGLGTDGSQLRMHHRNIRYDGYFPFSPLDRVIY